MSTKFDAFIKNEDTAKLLLRISVGMLLLPHGLYKLIHEKLAYKFHQIYRSIRRNGIFGKEQRNNRLTHWAPS